MLPLILSGLTVASRLCAGDEPDRGAIEFFERRVRPVLVERCLECHGTEAQENGLRLDSRAAVLRGGERGVAVVPGAAEQSLLIQALRRDGELQMPPSGPLKPAAIAAIERWIQLGAPWPAARPLLAPGMADVVRYERIHRLRQQHWAFQPIRKPAVPPADDPAWVRNPIDHFILAGLNAQNLSPSPEADRRTLIRRLYFDLIGLPPHATVVEAFALDSSPSAYEKLVRALLDRPAYGQRWARHWLDVARYADTTGYQEGAERRFPFAWTYRDYVVRSLNEDTPYDQFVVEQVAADQLDFAPEQRWKLAAMGFLTLGPRFNYVRHEIIDDRIDVVTRGLMGLTVTCARCHDHKYDPVLADDYYGLYGVFASSREPLYTDLPRIGPARGDFARYREFRKNVARATRRFEQFHARVHQRVQHEMRALAGDYLRYLVQLMPAHRTAGQPSFDTERGHIRGPTPYGPGAIVRWQHYISSCGDEDPVLGLWKQLAKVSRDEFAEQVESLRKQTDEMNPTLRTALIAAAPRSMLEVATVYGEVLERTYAQWTDYQATNLAEESLPDTAAEQLRQVLYAADSPIAMNEDEAHDCYTDGEFNEYMGLKRELDALFVEYQDVAAPRAMVMADRAKPQEPRVFSRGQATQPGGWVARRFLRVLADVDGGESFSEGSGRRQLARAIVNPRNPLTARVIVNRVWQWHFGRGLVDTASDFGTRAKPPSHPRLLDWLAADFIEHGWSLKRLHTQIVTSSTYRQVSFTSHESYKADPDNRLLSHMNRRRLGFEALRDSLLAVAGRLKLRPGGPPVAELDSPRRSLYLLVNRDDPPGVLATFDFPSPDISIARRAETTVPPQALFLMNNEFTSSIAEQLVKQMQDDLGEGEPAGRIEWLYRRVLSRSPDESELALATDILGLTPSANETATATKDQWRDLAHVLLMSNEFIFVD